MLNFTVKKELILNLDKDQSEMLLALLEATEGTCFGEEMNGFAEALTVVLQGMVT